MSFAELFESTLEPEIQDADEGNYIHLIRTYQQVKKRKKKMLNQMKHVETFWLYSQPIPSSNLGFIDPNASSVDVQVGGIEYTIHQSPGVLSSDRAGGTTGAGRMLPRPALILSFMLMYSLVFSC